ncbi:hypothetical protein ACOMHN_021254 [Nucella lapillus]
MTERRRRPFVIAVLLVVITAGTCLEAGSTCVKVAVAMGTVTIVCPLKADVHDTKHSVVIKHFSGISGSSAEEVLGCDWLMLRKEFDCPPSSFGAELIAIRRDRVILARLPDAQLQNGSYRCQLVPPESKQPFTDCSICHYDNPLHPLSALASEESDGAKNKTSIPVTESKEQACNCNCSADRAELLIIVIITLTLVNVLLLTHAVWLVYFYHSRHMQAVGRSPDALI